MLRQRAVGLGAGLPQGTRVISLFFVNRRPLDHLNRDSAYIFQLEAEVRCSEGFVNRSNPLGRDSSSEDEDERIADLQYRHSQDYAVGHNIASDFTSQDGHCHLVRTDWVPLAEVERVGHNPDLRQYNLSLEDLAECRDAQAVRQSLGPLVGAYAAWIDSQAQTSLATAWDGPNTCAERETIREELLHRARVAKDRLSQGLDLLDQADIFAAFTTANRAVAAAIRQREANEGSCTPESVARPTWYPFQIGFILANLAGIAQPDSPDRQRVDLLFFPTGGGKTEAYLGLAAFTLILRRLRGGHPGGLGVSVIMRYTLRLLTLDQLDRAATLICALERLRQQDPQRLGDQTFEIGLWVGDATTPNRLGGKGDKSEYSAYTKLRKHKADSARNPSPVPLERCPWCAKPFSPNAFSLKPNDQEPNHLMIACLNGDCPFHSRRGGLPILIIDDDIYRRLPAFLVATVDKWASMPWEGRIGALFGKVQSWDEAGFYQDKHKHKRPLPEGLAPPDLVIQDELHLISGPLGTMTGLYETAFDRLCQDRNGHRPKIIASTATVRRAARQIRALFGRNDVAIFPPQGADRHDHFFAVTDRSQPGRWYLGLAAPGRSMKVALLRTYLTLLAAAQHQANAHKQTSPQPADPYLTLLGYFGSLRELGGSRRIVEDEVRSRLADIATQRKRLDESPTILADRKRLSEPKELTSRVGTDAVAKTRQALATAFPDKDAIDVALATNMIAVGLDIRRLGLMVVLGQPKTAAEYIQATSRVGRDPQRPGLVVTLLNIHRPRDRSHYERFRA